MVRARVEAQGRFGRYSILRVHHGTRRAALLIHRGQLDLSAHVIHRHGGQGCHDPLVAQQRAADRLDAVMAQSLTKAHVFETARSGEQLRSRCRANPATYAHPG